MLFLFIFATSFITYDICGAALPHVTCNRDGKYRNIGCYHTAVNGKHRKDFYDMKLLINDRDENSPYNDGHVLNWEEFPQSTHSLACRCAAKAKSMRLYYFSIRFYGECWGGRELARLHDVIQNDTWLSTGCSNPEYQPCNDKNKTECVGHADVDYIFKVVDRPIHPKPGVNGGFSEWSQWEGCDKTCHECRQVRERSCTNPVPQGNGKPCDGEYEELKWVMLPPCPVNGSYGPWSNYTECSKTCGGGFQSRTRKCNMPSPAHGGMNCTSLGASDETKICNTKSCTECVFPFEYNGRKYYKCTTANHNRLWCAYDHVYKSGNWKNC